MESTDPDPDGDNPADITDGSTENWDEGMLGAIRFDGLSSTANLSDHRTRIRVIIDREIR